MGLVLTTSPTRSEILALLSVAKMKESLRISYTKEDTLLGDCIVEAYDWLCRWLRRDILATTWTHTAAGFPTALVLERSPFIEVEYVGYNLDGDPEVVDDAVYTVLTNSMKYGVVSLATDQVWPTEFDAGDEAVTIQFTTGFGDAATIQERHASLVKALKLLAGDYFRNREDTFMDSRVTQISRNITNDVKRVAGSYKIYNDVGG